jgi:hypothetical protein
MTAGTTASSGTVAFDADDQWWPLKLANRAGAVGSSVIGHPFPRLDLDLLVARARTQTGLHDLGADWNQAAADQLVRSLDTQAGLTTIGRRLARGHVLADLEVRLRLTEAYRRRPSVLDRSIDRPVLIINLPRSGATLLQFLLARSPDIRSLWAWEALDPTTGADSLRSRRDGGPGGQRRAGRRHQVVARLVPGYHELHPMAADEPEECNALLGRSFDALDVAAIFDVPSYVDRWLLGDHRVSYREMKAQVQLLQGEEPPRHWLLRTPAHLFALDAIYETFPAACIVQIHRDPVATVSSFCSLAATIRRANSTGGDPTALGPRWTEVWAQGMDRAMEARHRAPATTSFVDVAYEQLVHDPVATVGRVLEALDADPGVIDPGVLDARVQAGRQGRRHVYEPAWFGIDPDALRARFAAYIDHFDVQVG